MNGLLFIVSAPSGAGKTSLLKALLPTDERLSLSISHTTRTPRPGEEDGVHYHFVSVARFQELAGAGEFLEQAEVFGNYYGTSALFLDKWLSAGRDILLDIDVQGTRQILTRYPDSVTMFILPPSMDVLRQRLIQRGSENRKSLQRRLEVAESEMARKHLYRYVIINNELSVAADELVSIIQAHQGL